MKSIVSIICALLYVLDVSAQESAQEFTTGVYGNPLPLVDDKYSFNALGINALFVRSSSLSDALIEKARKEDVRVYVEFPVLNGKDYLKDHPEAWPIDQQGKRAMQADWFMGICLTDPGFKKYRTDQLRMLLSQFEVDGIWLDYLHWHAQFESPEPILPETCFCDRCITTYARQKGKDVQGQTTASRSEWILAEDETAWRAWRSDVILEWVTDLRSLLKTRNPVGLLGVYYCPWYPAEYDGALYKILGLDVPALSRIADVMSPMLYHERMGRSASWVSDYVQWFEDSISSQEETNVKLWPIVQAHDVDPDEFGKVLEYGSETPSSGIMMFTISSVLENSRQLAVMKSIYIGKLK